MRNSNLRTVADQLLEEHRVEFIDDGVLTVTLPTGFTHGDILAAIRSAVYGAHYLGFSRSDWECASGDFRFDLVDDPLKFCVPDLAIAHPGSKSKREFRENHRQVASVPGGPGLRAVRNTA